LLTIDKVNGVNPVNTIFDFQFTIFNCNRKSAIGNRNIDSLEPKRKEDCSDEVETGSYAFGYAGLFARYDEL